MFTSSADCGLSSSIAPERCVARGFVDLAVYGLASMYQGLCLERFDAPGIRTALRRFRTDVLATHYANKSREADEMRAERRVRSLRG